MYIERNQSKGPHSSSQMTWSCYLILDIEEYYKAQVRNNELVLIMQEPLIV